MIIGQTSPRFVVKCFSERPGLSSDRSVKEFRLLQRLSAALQGQAGVIAPRPVAVSEDLNAYIMTAVPGVPLDDYLRKRAVDTAVVGRLVEALSAYYRLAECPYGDFHPGNVLVDASGLALIDPGGPSLRFDAAFAAADRSSVAADLGYWTYSVAVRAPRLAASGPRRAMRLCRVTRALLRAAAQKVDGAEQQWAIIRAARVHLDGLAKGNAKERLLAVWGRVAIRALVSRARRGQGRDEAAQRASAS